MIAYYTNMFNEPLEEIGDIVCNLDYWDCECEKDYIQPITKDICFDCGALREDMPASREHEVNEYRQKQLSRTI